MSSLVAAQVDPAIFRNDVLAMSARTHFSSSRQFIIHDVAKGSKPALKLDKSASSEARPGPGMAFSLHEILDAQRSSKYVRLDASALTMSCERIKHALLRELEMPDKWRGKIHLDLRRARTPDDAIIALPITYFGNWEYHVSLPDVLERPRVVKSVVELVLLEISERESERSVEVPTWLTLGLAQELILSSDEELVLDRPEQVISSANVIQVKSKLDVSWRRADSLKLANQELHDAPPLTWEELSWPKPEDLDGKAGEVYSSSAQLLVHELLKFKDGRQCMRDFIRALPRHLNWQLAFRQAFHGHFANQLELEKWWALKVVDFTGRDLSQTWPMAESWEKLDEIVHPTAEVRSGPNSLPTRTNVNFQTIIRNWDFGRQTAVLRERAKQLGLLRGRVCQEMVGLVDDYRRALEGYLEKRDRVGFDLFGKTATFGTGRNVQGALRELDVLDIRREQMRPKQETAKAETGSQAVSR